MATQTKPPKWRKLLISAVMGGVIGAGAMLAVSPLFSAGTFGAAGASEAVAAMIGTVYAAISLAMAIGLASPRMGAEYLNMEDADEIRQQRRMMAYCCAGLAAMGIGLLVLALAGPGGLLSPAAGLWASLALFAASVPLTILQWRHMDELMRKVTTETGNLSYYLLLLVGGGWAMLAHLGFAQAPAPLDWLTMLFGLVLVASAIATGRRGMLHPR